MPNKEEIKSGACHAKSIYYYPIYLDKRETKQLGKCQLLLIFPDIKVQMPPPDKKGENGRLIAKMDEGSRCNIFQWFNSHDIAL